MIVTGSRLRQIGWVVVLTVCVAAFLALSFKVRAVVSEVRLAERKIVTLENTKVVLETEFQARANQQQLANWNAVDFGFRAPGAEQFVENERQLADFGTPRGVNAPDPIRVARAPIEVEERISPAMVSPMTGRPLTASPRAEISVNAGRTAVTKVDIIKDKRSLAERMALSDLILADQPGSPTSELSE